MKGDMIVCIEIHRFAGYIWACFKEWYLNSKNWDYLFAVVIHIDFCRGYCVKFSGIEKCVAQRSANVAVLIVSGTLLITVFAYRDWEKPWKT